MNKLLVFIILFITTTGWAQENFVPNPSFEDKINCPDNFGQIEAVEPWTAIRGTVDYYNECATATNLSIPVNWVGGGYAHSGQAYIGLAVLAITIPNAREFAGVSLTNTLIPAKKYNVEFYISMADSMWYAVKNIGIYFSIGPPPSNTSILLGYEPQVKYEGTDFLTEKEGWIKIQGSFIAEGGENFITLGNFDDDNETDTMFISGGGVNLPNPDYWTTPYYFIDDVSVTVDTTTGINETEQIPFSCYPNPVQDKLIIEIESIVHSQQTMVRLHDLTGRVVLTMPLQAAKTSIDISMLGAGVYVAVLEQKDRAVARMKIVKE